MSLKEIKVKLRLYDNGAEVSPFASELIYSSSFVTGYNKVTITGSASDEAVAITDQGTVKLLELRVKPDDLDKISVKYNGSSQAYNVNPIELITEDITGITASNSNSSEVDLYWRALYV